MLGLEISERGSGISSPMFQIANIPSRHWTTPHFLKRVERTAHWSLHSNQLQPVISWLFVPEQFCIWRYVNWILLNRNFIPDAMRVLCYWPRQITQHVEHGDCLALLMSNLIKLRTFFGECRLSYLAEWFTKVWLTMTTSRTSTPPKAGPKRPLQEFLALTSCSVLENRMLTILMIQTCSLVAMLCLHRMENSHVLLFGSKTNLFYEEG